jgi:ankyrin repeat protein
MGNQVTFPHSVNRPSSKLLSYSLVKELIEAGADPNIAVCLGNCSEIVVDFQDNFGYTPLHAATLNCNPILVDLLIVSFIPCLVVFPHLMMFRPFPHA